MRTRIVTIAGVLSGGFALAGAATLLVVTSCTGDDNVASADGGTDGTTDGLGAAETGQDGRVGDGGSEADVGSLTDGSAESEAAPFDANFDAPPINEFPPATTAAYCLRLQQCCMVADAGWDQNLCISEFGQGGGFRGLELHEGALDNALDSGVVTYDKSAVPKCLNDIATIPCGILSASTIVAVQNDCFAAFHGTLGVDAGPCTDGIECLTNQYCRLVGDSGMGTCVPLLAQGQPCTDTTYSMDCTYLGNGSPALYCDPTGSTCQPAGPLDSGCGSVGSGNAGCASGVCNYPSCVASITFGDPATCGSFLTDAGAGD